MATMAQVDAEIARTLRTLPLATISTGTAGSYGTFWSGTYPGLGGRACDDATPGALFSPPSNDSGRLGYAVAPLTGSMTTLFLADRLVDVSGISVATTALQSVTHPALPRETTGDSVFAWLEVVGTATGSPASNATFIYRNSLDVPRAITLALPSGWATQRRAIPIPVFAGDLGVRSWQSLQFDTAGPNAGDVAIVLARLIAMVPQTTTAVATAYQRSGHVNAVRGGLPRVRAGACPMAYGIGNTANLGNVLLTYAVTELVS